MNQTIKNLKEAEEGCGIYFEKDLNNILCENGELCEKCENKKQTSKTALQEMKEELEKQNNIMEEKRDFIEEIYVENKIKIKKIQEALKDDRNNKRT